MKEISTTDLENKLNAGESLQLIDVREDDEVATGMIPSANHIRLSEIPERLNELDKDKHYYMICRSGGRSGKASKYLEERGFQVTNMVGGMLDWHGNIDIPKE